MQMVFKNYLILCVYMYAYACVDNVWNLDSELEQNFRVKDIKLETNHSFRI